MAKKVYNINEMAKVLVVAHNTGNVKAINRDMINGAEIDPRYFSQWQVDVKSLKTVVFEYVQAKKNARFDQSITEEDVTKLRNRIYPKWKTLLSCAEPNKFVKQLRIHESDIEDLIGFVWDFFATAKGTAEAEVGDTVFRRKVEALIGCEMAKNAVLNDAERETLDRYYKAIRSIDSCKDKIAELEKTRKSFELLITPQTSEDFKHYLNAQIKQIDEDIKVAKESMAKSEQDSKEWGAKAHPIELKIKFIK